MKSRRLTALLLSGAVAVTSISISVLSDAGSVIAYAESSWSETSTGVWSYTHADASQDIPWLDIDITDKDWSTIKYVSADVTVSGTAAAAFGGSVGEDWYNCDPKEISDDTVTIYLEPNGKDFSSLEINFDNEAGAEAGTVITISNITFSTEERDYSDVVGEWYQQDESWHYRNGDADAAEIAGLDILQAASESIDWSAVKYISADIETTSTAQPVIDINFTGTDEGWTSGSPKTVTNDTATVYYNTNGEEPVWANLSLWQYEDGVALAADQLVTVSNITFSTEERDYSDVVGEWYEQDGSWYYRNGDSIAYDSIPSLNLENTVTDWSSIKYISADVTVEGKANPVIGANKNGSWANGTEALTENGSTTIYMNTSGAEIADPCIEFWWCSENADVLSANAIITVSNITFSTEERDYSDVVGEWYEQDGSWYYRNGDSIAYDSIPTLGLDTSSVSDWSAIKYISADVTVEGKANPVIGANKNGSWANGTEALTENGSTTIYMYTNGAEIADPCIEFWWCSENADVLSANALMTVSNITFSTEERDFSNVIGEWYSPEDGTWCFRNGGSAASEIPCLNLDYSSVSDWSAIKYVSAKVEVSGIANPVIGGDNNGDWIDGAPVYTENDSTVVFLYTEGREFADLNINFWQYEDGVALAANQLVTVSNITFSETYPTDYTSITGQWVKTSDGQYYYNHGDRSDIAYVEGLVPDCPYDIADVQSISITAKVVMAGGTPESIKLVVTGEGKDGEWFDGYNFPFGTDEQTVVRKYRGNVVSNPHLDISFGQNDLAVIENGGSIEIYVSDISYSIDPIEITYSTPNDLLIDDNETDITGDNEHDIMYHGIVNIETTGTLKIYTENIGSAQDINVFWREWSDFSNITTLKTTPVAVGDGVYEIRVTEEALNIIHEKAPYKCELALTGTGYTFVMATFTPDPDAPEPKHEEIKPDDISDEDKEKLESSKDNIMDEYDAPDSSDDFEYGRPHGHKSGRKWHHKHGWVYALRIVEKVDKELLKHAENVTITVYSKKADQYITLTADTCFSYLNIDGKKVKAGGKDAFITVILDGIPEDDELSFTSFNINYKK